jgi:ankyrin repeat protein
MLTRSSVSLQWKLMFGQNGWTSLMKAAERGHSEVIQLLLDFGANSTLRNHDVRSHSNSEFL